MLKGAGFQSPAVLALLATSPRRNLVTAQTFFSVIGVRYGPGPGEPKALMLAPCHPGKEDAPDLTGWMHV